jgi:polysaccharide export outer membrane protein
MTIRESKGGNASAVCGRRARIVLFALLPLFSACSLFGGPQDVPPPWDSNNAPASSIMPDATTSTRYSTSGEFAPADVSTPSPQRPVVYSGDASDVQLRSRAVTSPPPPPKLTVIPHPPLPPSVSSSSGHVPSSMQLAENVPAFGSPRPVATVPAPAGPAGYVIGIGDTLEVNVFGQPDLSGSVIVSSDGSVPLALVGKTQVAGMTPAQAADHISDELRRGQYLVNPQVSVTLSQFLSQQISVLGEVKNPGRFPVSVRLTVLDALALAGGVTELGSQRIYVLRPDTSAAGGVVTRYEIDLEALMSAGAGQEYFDIRAGDTIMVPRAEVFYIYGEVRLPNSYKLRPDMTVMQALSLGGGLTDKGSNSRLQLRRRGPDGRLITLSAHLTDRVEPDDVIYVRERIF